MKQNEPALEEIQSQVAIQRAVANARWYLIIGLGTVGLVLKVIGKGYATIHPTYLQIVLLVVSAAIYNSIYLLYIKRNTRCTARGLNMLSFFQVTVDIVIFSSIIYLAGGIDSSAFLYYVFPIIAASQLYRTRGILYAVFLSSTLFSAIIGLEFLQIIPHFPAYREAFSPNHYLNPFFTTALYLNVMFSLMLAGVFASVTTQIKEEHAIAIKKERDRISAIIESLRDGIILINNSNSIILVNKSARRTLNIKRDALIGITADRSHLASKSEYARLFAVLFPDKSDNTPTLKQKYEVTIETPFTMTFDVATVPVKDRKGITIGFLKIIHDITREKAIDRMKSEFISIAAHQLRTPLSAIKWSLKMVLDGDIGPLSKDLHEFISKSYSTNERMIRLVNDLLNVSRIEEGRFRYTFTPIDITQFLHSVIQEIRPAIDKKKIKLVWQPSKSALPKIQVDADRLRLAMQNLLDNAIHYTPSGGTIRVSTARCKKEYIKISIQDTGMGIPKKEQHRLFTKFYRGTNVIKKQTEGSGLGLFIVKNIIEKHNGHIEYKSALKKGTTFFIYLPIPSSTVQKGKQQTETFKQFVTDF